MSRTYRSREVNMNLWSYKSNQKRDFQQAVNKDFDNDMLGYFPRSRHLKSALQNAWDDKVPGAVDDKFGSRKLRIRVIS
jgi:hypothetical protein